MIEYTVPNDLHSPRMPFTNEERYAHFLEKLRLHEQEKSAPVIPEPTHH